MGGLCLYPEKTDDFNYLLGFMNTKVAQMQLDVINPTISYPPGTIGMMSCKETEKEKVGNIVDECITIAKDNWNTMELNWDFKKHPLI